MEAFKPRIWDNLAVAVLEYILTGATQTFERLQHIKDKATNGVTPEGKLGCARTQLAKLRRLASDPFAVTQYARPDAFAPAIADVLCGLRQVL